MFIDIFYAFLFYILGYLPILTYILELGKSKDYDVMIRPIRNNDEAIQQISSAPSYKNVIVDLVAEECVDFTRKAFDARLMSGYYNYHFTTMVGGYVGSLLW